ncbi:MAG TPA: HlyD family efflux transporter periplasmic adaptor subunit [Thermoanaerobaculia bacterium]|jgi:hypothetical protein|nr:HlyD family efflux transporter periplasmic adaptor subunit [Thermoanaerobaculia bacterium]
MRQGVTATPTTDSARERKSRKTALRIGLALLVLIALAGLAWATRSGKAPASPRDWAVIERGDLVTTVPVSGELEAEASVMLGPPQIPETWEYKIADLAPEGQSVPAGTPVVRFDTADLERQQLEKTAERDSAEQEIAKKRTELALARGEAEVALAEAEARLRKSTLDAQVPPELSSRIELEGAKADLALAEKEVAYRRERLRQEARRGAAELGALSDKRNRAAARLREVEESIEKMTVRAPRAGTVIYVADRNGQKKRIGDSCWQMQKVVELPDLGRMRARGEVSESDVGRLTGGQTVRLALDALPDLPVAGQVESVDRAVREERGKERSEGKVIALDISLPGSVAGAGKAGRTETPGASALAGRLRPGMRFRGTIEISRATGLLLIPAESVFPSARGPRVLRRTAWGFEEVFPKLGRRTPEAFEVLAGLRPGDAVARRDLAEEAQ